MRPRAYRLQLSDEGGDRDRRVAILGPLFQSAEKVTGRAAAIRSPGEEEIVLRVPERQRALGHVAERDRRDLVDARAPGRTGSGEDHFPNEPWLFLCNHLRNKTSEREAEEVDLFQAPRPDERDGVLRHGRDRIRSRALRRPDPSVVEGDHAAPGRNAVHDSRIPPVQFRCQMIEEDHRHTAVRTELPIGELRPGDIDASGRRIRPCDRFRYLILPHHRVRHFASPQARAASITIDDERLHGLTRTGEPGREAVGASSRRFFRMPASTRPAGANLRSKRRRFASLPAEYRSFGRSAFAAFRTTSATTLGSSPVAITSLSTLPKAARASRYSSSFELGSSRFVSNC